MNAVARARWATIGVRLVLGVTLTFGAAGCRRRDTKIESLRDALVRDDGTALRAALAGHASCPSDAPPAPLAPAQGSKEEAGCFGAIAKGLGASAGFRAHPADDATAATAAIVLLRDGRGDTLARADAWLGAEKAGKGAGFDALRLAVGRAMASAAEAVGRPIDDETTARRVLAAIAASLPGACPTYALLGRGQANEALPPALSAEHSACIQHDLERREGPGPRYGSGLWRAVEGALSLWRETERALRLGLAMAAPEAKTRLESDLARVEPATLRIATKRLPEAAPQETLTRLGEMHADAGLFAWGDAGPDGAAPAATRGR